MTKPLSSYEENESLEKLYGLTKNPVITKRVKTLTGKYLEIFESPGDVLVSIDFPEFTCLCPKTSHPDFANVKLIYLPDKWCVELKSYKYYLNSFRNEGHFHEQVICMIEKDLRSTLEPKRLFLQGKFNVRGGTYPIIECGDQG